MAFSFSSDKIISGLVVVEPQVFTDERGWFMEIYKNSYFIASGIDVKFVQVSQSFSAKTGTIRGLHLQLSPHTQAKLVRCLRGQLLDVAVDIRRGSPTYGKYLAVELTADNKRMLWIPEGFAHGFCTLVDNTELEYCMTQEWSPPHERYLLWSDPTIGIKWPTTNPILSAKDAAGVTLDKLDHNFVWKS